jgi:ABC-type transporter Mla MlaB component
VETVMLRITKTRESRDDVLLMLEGKVSHQWAALLDGVCRAYLAKEKTVQLDCAGVDFVDARGAAILKMFLRERVTLLNAPCFVTQTILIGE